MHNNKRKIISTMLFLSLGFLCLILGSIGIVLPLLPTVPFYLVTVFCFARSSEKLYDWFTHTSMYKKHLESFVQKKGHDTAHKVYDHRKCLFSDGHRFPYDEICSGRQDLTRHRMDLPHHLFLFCCKNYKRGRRRYFSGNRIKKLVLWILHRVPAILRYSL